MVTYTVLPVAADNELLVLYLPGHCSYMHTSILSICIFSDSITFTACFTTQFTIAIDTPRYNLSQA